MILQIKINICKFIPKFIYKYITFDIRQMIKTTHISSPGRKNQIVLNERDIINAIQQCPQIIKQDKLFIRNKIKQFFREFQPGETQHNEFTQLLQIFSQCRKPLNRIHLYENHSHWLQVKLRKYITNQRRKLKQQCINQFKRQKCEQKAKKKNVIEKRIKYQDSYQKDSRKKMSGSLLSSQIKYHNSFQQKNATSPKNFYDLKKFNQTCRNYNPTCSNLSPSYRSGGQRFVFPQTCKNFTSFGHQNPTFFKSKTNRSISKNSCSSKPKNKKIFQQKKTYQSFKKNLKQKTKKNQKQNQGIMIGSSKLTYDNTLKFSQFPLQFCKISNQRGPVLHQIEDIRTKLSYLEESINKKEEDMSFQNFQPYQYKPKIQNFAKCQGLSSIKQVKQNQQPVRQNIQVVSKFHERSSNQNLYTSPELLEQCRRFIKKTQYQSKNVYDKNTIENIHTQEQVVYYTYESQNIFDNIQCYQYHSPQFKKKNQRYKDIKELLKDLFKNNWRIYLSNLQKQQIIQKSPYGYQQLVILLVNQVDPKTKLISFLDLIPLLKTSINLSFSFSNIFLLLDVDSKGIVTQADYDSFIQNFIQCPIQSHILRSLKQKLSKFKSVVSQTFKDQRVVPGCFEYLQLIENKQIFQLGQVLQMFQFQIDGDSKSLSNDVYQ